MSPFYDFLARVTSKRVANQFVVTASARVAEKLVGGYPALFNRHRHTPSSDTEHLWGSNFHTLPYRWLWELLTRMGRRHL